MHAAVREESGAAGGVGASTCANEPFDGSHSSMSSSMYRPEEGESGGGEGLGG